MKRKRWLIGGIITSLVPFLLLFDDSTHEGFGPFILIGFLVVLVPIFFGLGSLIGYFFDKYASPDTSKSFYTISIVLTIILSYIMLMIFYPNAAHNPSFGYILKTLFLNVYHLPLHISLLILILSIIKRKKSGHK